MHRIAASLSGPIDTTAMDSPAHMSADITDGLGGHLSAAAARGSGHLLSVAKGVHERAKGVHEQANERYGDRNVFVGANVIIGVIIMGGLIYFFAKKSKGRHRKSRPAARAQLPAFDLEGGASNGSGPSLHPTIAEAATTADVATMRTWLADDRCVVSATMGDGSTALHLAAYHGHANMVRMLLEGGADVLSIDAHMRTPLHLVAAAGHGLCVKALLDAGGDPEAKDATGATALEVRR